MGWALRGNREEGVINHIPMELEFSRNTTTQTSKLQIKIQWMYKKLNLKQTYLHTSDLWIIREGQIYWVFVETTEI